MAPECVVIWVNKPQDSKRVGVVGTEKGATDGRAAELGPEMSFPAARLLASRQRAWGPSWVRAARLVAIATGFALAVTEARADPGDLGFGFHGDLDFQLDFSAGGVPTTGEDAKTSLPARIRAVTAFQACGRELDYLRLFRSQKPSDTSGEDTINLALAKMSWYAGLPGRDGNPTLSSLDPQDPYPCVQTFSFNKKNVPVEANPPPTGPLDFFTELKKMSALRVDQLRGQYLNGDMAAAFGPACNNVVSKVTNDGPPDLSAADISVYTVTFFVPRDCLRLEINTLLRNAKVTGQMGSGDKLPCHLLDKRTDDNSNWDFSVKGLIRAVFLDQHYRRWLSNLDLNREQPSILDDDVVNHIRQVLIITDIHLGQPDYSVITGCGDTEHATGDATDRVDTSNFFRDVGNDIGDVLDWLLNHWYVAYPPTAALAAPGLPAIIAAIAPVGSVVLQQARIPETENHRLMIETSRYLNNQLLLADLQSAGDVERIGILNGAQDGVRDWLLQRLQDILKNDFIEFNARPYQHESIAAIMNLYDFADDPNVADAAGFVLEYAFAKFALGSSQGRRLVPFRRHMQAVVNQLENPTNAPLVVTGTDADHQVALGFLYAGQTQQLAGNMVSNSVAGEAGFDALSAFRPDPLVLDLAIDKSVAYDEAIRHAGVEIYSSGQGFLITAGGVLTDYAYSVAGIGDPNDRGAGVATTVMLTGVIKTRMTDFARFYGLREQVKGLGDPQITYDHNICVTRGFACGLNMVLPADIDGCKTPGPPDREPFWFFVDSSQCGYGANPNDPKVYLVLYKRPCLGAVDGCDTSGFFGFVEAVDAGNQSFADFISGVLARNPPGLTVLMATGGASETVSFLSTYIASDGRGIEFDPTANIRNSSRSGIEAINGTRQPDISDWPLAVGDVIQKDKDALVTIRNPRLGVTLTLDLRDTSAPHRTYNLRQ